MRPARVLAYPLFGEPIVSQPLLTSKRPSWGDQRRGYHHWTEAWYAAYNPPRECADEVLFGVYPESGGTSGELAMRWYVHGSQPVARLECFHDAFAVLAQHHDLLDELAQRGNVTPAEFMAMLQQHGFVDLTARQEPAR